MAFTYFFRDRQTLDLITRHALPALTGHRYITIWDAGCAHGPEPYSIAILLRENMSHFLFRNVRILATDIDSSNQFGQTITRGLYPEQELKRIPADLHRRYFTKADLPGHYEIAREIRNSVSFIPHDLLSLQPIRTGLSLIVCKNVLLHFSSQQRMDVIEMFHTALRNGGFLVTEPTQKLPHRVKPLFEQITVEGQVFSRLEAHVARRTGELEARGELVA